MDRDEILRGDEQMVLELLSNICLAEKVINCINCNLS